MKSNSSLSLEEKTARVMEFCLSAQGDLADETALRRKR